ncbi:MAG: tripartite tricarboxylate transporter TctB family protein [Thermodesulfobacteriota bacterium]
MLNSDRISSLFWLAAGIGITLLSIKYDFGNFLSPGAGFITFFAGALLSLLSLILFISSGKKRGPQSDLKALWKGLDWKKVVYILILLFIYTLVLKPLGFLIGTFLLLIFLFKVKGSYSWWKVLLLAFLITSGAFLLFQVWLKVQLPKGVLEGMI